MDNIKFYYEQLKIRTRCNETNNRLVSVVHRDMRKSTQICNESNKMDYEPMKLVTQCENYRQVRSVLKAYNQPHFDDLVRAQEVFAKKSITRDYDIRFRYTAFPSY